MQHSAAPPAVAHINEVVVKEVMGLSSGCVGAAGHARCLILPGQLHLAPDCMAKQLWGQNSCAARPQVVIASISAGSHKATFRRGAADAYTSNVRPSPQAPPHSHSALRAGALPLRTRHNQPIQPHACVLNCFPAVRTGPDSAGIAVRPSGACRTVA